MIDAALARHHAILDDPLRIAAALGGRELAAILGAALAARHRRIPTLLDGFVCTAAVAPLAKLRAGALDHALAGHMSAESGHRLLLEELALRPLLDLGMRLGEGSGAAVAVLVLRAALACHTGMATFAQAACVGEGRLSLHHVVLAMAWKKVPVACPRRPPDGPSFSPWLSASSANGSS